MNVALTKDLRQDTVAPNIRSFRILVVEDDPEYADWLGFSLKRTGHQCSKAEGLGRAREALRLSTPDMIILDEGLADGSGLELCREVRREHRTAGAIIAVLTGRKSVWNGRDWEAAGADTCWPKPRSVARIQSLVKGLFNRRDRDTMVVKPLIPTLLIDPKQRTVIYADVPSANLSYREILFMDLLSNAYPEELSHEEIARKVFAASRSEDVRSSVRVFVNKLKQKLPPKLSRGIEGLRGRGYRLKIPA